MFFSIFASISGLYGYLYFPVTFSNLIFSYTLSYFFYDIIAAIYYKFEPIFIFHGIISFIVYLLSIYGYYPKHALFFLSYEFSTIFLSAMKILPKNSLLLHKINNLLFFFTFFIFRIFFGTIVSVEFIQLVVKELQEKMDILKLFLLSINGMFFVLNYYWFYKIIKKAIKSKV
jgi:hypothetical protein